MKNIYLLHDEGSIHSKERVENREYKSIQGRIWKELWYQHVAFKKNLNYFQWKFFRQKLLTGKVSRQKNILRFSTRRERISGYLDQYSFPFPRLWVPGPGNNCDWLFDNKGRQYLSEEVIRKELLVWSGSTHRYHQPRLPSTVFVIQNKNRGNNGESDGHYWKHFTKQDESSKQNS